MSIWDDHLTEQRGVGKGLLELFLTGKVRVGGREQGEKILEALGPRLACGWSYGIKRNSGTLKVPEGRVGLELYLLPMFPSGWEGIVMGEDKKQTRFEGLPLMRGSGVSEARIRLQGPARRQAVECWESPGDTAMHTTQPCNVDNVFSFCGDRVCSQASSVVCPRPPSW